MVVPPVSEPKSDYGPWMVAQNRRQRSTERKVPDPVRKSTSTKEVFSGSRFAALAKISENEIGAPSNMAFMARDSRFSDGQGTKLTSRYVGKNNGGQGLGPLKGKAHVNNEIDNQGRRVVNGPSKGQWFNKSGASGQNVIASSSIRPVQVQDTNIIVCENLDGDGVEAENEVMLDAEGLGGAYGAGKQVSSLMSSDHRNRNPPNSHSPSIVPETQGFLGGLWICWDSQHVQFYILFSSTQVIHSIVKVGEEQKWLLSAVYASPILAVRKKLWEAIEEFASVVLHTHGRTGGRRVSELMND